MNKSDYNQRMEQPYNDNTKLHKLYDELRYDLQEKRNTIARNMVYKSLQKRWKDIVENSKILWTMMKEMVYPWLSQSNYVCWNKQYYKQRSAPPRL